MKRQDQRASLCDLKIIGRNGDAAYLELGDLLTEMPWIKHDAVADHRERSADNTRRQQAQLVGFVTDHQRVAGIVATLKTDDDIRAFGEPVNNLALAFVAPTGLR